MCGMVATIVIAFLIALFLKILIGANTLVAVIFFILASLIVGILLSKLGIE